ncbi:hypothetical protein [Klebsiella aerogenes]|uniref:hypothetical protein n=1 Tax=Klebsiella aerogenes TaxID=548 RepID=UPI0038779173
MGALEKGDESADCHLWYAVLCGQLAEHESIQRRIQSGFSFKDSGQGHLTRVSD